MAKPNNESCQAWYKNMRADKAKLEAYRIRKRDWQRKQRGYHGAKGQDQTASRFQEEQEQRRESRLQPVHEMASRDTAQPSEDAA